MIRANKARALPLALLLLAALAGFLALGSWQVRRLAWKEALIARVDAARAAPSLDGAALIAGRPEGLEYRKAHLAGNYLPAGTALVFAATELGSGYWTLTPLRLAGGGVVYVNRGYVPMGTSLAMVRDHTPAGPVVVDGLVRLSEPGGTWLRANRPAAGRWYSRDVAAMAARTGIGPVPGVFVDASAESPAPSGPVAPVAGLTRLEFPNNHRAYALTWFALAALCAGGLVVLWRGPR